MTFSNAFRFKFLPSEVLKISWLASSERLLSSSVRNKYLVLTSKQSSSSSGSSVRSTGFSDVLLYSKSTAKIYSMIVYIQIFFLLISGQFLIERAGKEIFRNSQFPSFFIQKFHQIRHLVFSDEFTGVLLFDFFHKTSSNYELFNSVYVLGVP